MRIVLASWTRAALTLPLLVLLLVLVTGAWWLGRGSGDVGKSSSADTGGSAAMRDASTADGDSARDEGRSGAEPASATDPLTRAVISTGQITLSATSIGRARSEVTSLVAGWGGTVADEETQSDEEGRLVESTLTLRVPSARFDDAMDALGRVGTVVHRSRSSEDVTTQVIDNAARVRAAERSIRQIERLLDRAEKLSDIIAIESDLARRQADLDSLTAQQAWLSDQTSLSTVGVFLHLADSVRAGDDQARGFLAGLGRGWDALGRTMVLALTAVGAVLPFAAVLLLVGGPGWLLVRRRRASVPTASPAPADS